MRKILIILFALISLNFCDNILTLSDCIKIGIENNLKIKMAEERINQAYLQKEISKKYLLPTLSTNFNYIYLGDNQPITFGNFPPIKFVENNEYTLKFTLNLPLFTGKRLENTYKASEELYEKSKIDYENEISNLILDIKKAYFNVLKAKKILDTSLKYKERLEKHLIDTKKMFEEGFVTKLDILKMELALKDAETKIIESENYLKLSKANLNYVLNRPIDNDFEIEDILEEKIEKRDYSWWKDMALRERKEIKSFEKLISIYEKNIEIERSQLFPQIYFFFNYNFEKGTQTSREEWDTNWNTGILLTYDIWNWGQNKDRIKKRESEKKEIENQFLLLKNSIEIEVKNAYLNLISSENKIEQGRKEIEVAEETLRVAELLYKEGLSTITDVIDAMTSLYQARNNYYNYLYEYKVAYSELEKVSGILKKETK